MQLAIHQGKSETQDEVILCRKQNNIIAQWFTKYEGREEWNQHVGIYEKWWALVGTRAKISPVAEGIKWTFVGD